MTLPGIDLLRQIILLRKVRKLKTACQIGERTRFLQGFDVLCQGALDSRIEIGNDSIISSQLIFESSDFGKIKIGDRCHLGGGTKVISRTCVTIGNDVTIAWDCTIYDHDSHPVLWEDRSGDTIQELRDLKLCKNPIAHKDWSKVVSKPIHIGDRAWLGFGVTILKGVSIGEESIIGANSVVTKSIPDRCIVMGSPAKVTKIWDYERNIWVKP